MRKKIFLLLFISSFFFLSLTVQKVFAQITINCGGAVTDIIGDPISGASVSIYKRFISPPQPELVGSTTTGADGTWSFTGTIANNEIVAKVEFEKNGYLPATWNPSVEHDCQTGTVALEGAGGLGWNCVDPFGATATDRCTEVPGGTYNDLNTCVDECRRYKCVGAACTPCTSGDSPADCPYANDQCNGQCYIPGGPTSPAYPGIPVYPQPCGPKHILTAIGCVPAEDAGALITWLLGFAISIAGGIAIILMIFGGILVIFSAGNPERVQTGKTIFTSALMGLITIIFSVFLLRLIGVEVLKIFQ